jgi:hypothetical protein
MKNKHAMYILVALFFLIFSETTYQPDTSVIKYSGSEFDATTIEFPKNELSLDVNDQMWNCTCGQFDDVYVEAIANCSDGGYVMVGTASRYEIPSIWLVKVDQYGTFLWNYTYGVDAEGYDVIECESGGFAITGYQSTANNGDEILLLRTDANGNHLWNKTYGYKRKDYAHSILETNKGDLLLSGHVNSDYDNHTYILLWTDMSGKQIRNATGSFMLHDDRMVFYETIECANGDLLCVGDYQIFTGPYSFSIAKFNSTGSIEEVYTDTTFGHAYGVVENHNGQYSICGYNNTGLIYLELNPNLTERRLIVYDEVGLSPWEAIAEHPLGGFVIVGESSPNTLLIRIDSQGNLLWNTTLYGNFSRGKDVFIAEDTSIIFGADRDLSSGKNGWIVSIPSFYWVDRPLSLRVERDLGYYFDANISIEMFSDSWWFDNAFLEVDQSGLISTPGVLPMGLTGFTLTVNDTLGREIQTSFALTVNDNIAPHWITEPTDMYHEYGIIFSYDLDAADASGVVFTLNDTDNFEHIADGYFESSSVLPLGEYPLQVNISDSYGNNATAEFTVIVQDTTSPSLDSPQDYVKEYTTKESWLQWNCSDLLPDYFIITRNGTEIESDSWNGSELGVRLDGLDLGTYIFHIFVNDTSGNSAEDDVTVTIADLIAPTIDEPADVWTIEGITGVSITWTPDDLFPISYSIFVDDAEVETGEWNGSSISYSIDGLSVGIHNCTILVTDINENSVTDYVQIIVIDWDDITTTTTPTTTTPSITTTTTTGPTTGEPTWSATSIVLIAVLLSLAIVVGLINIRLMMQRKGGEV